MTPEPWLILLHLAGSACCGTLYHDGERAEYATLPQCEDAGRAWLETLRIRSPNDWFECVRVR